MNSLESSQSTLEPVHGLCVLPDSVFHKILSLLDIKELVLVSKLSRRCRKLCLSSPFLNVDQTVSDVTEFHQFADCLDRFISLHNGASLLQFQLRLNCWEVEHDVGFRISTWLLYMVRRNIETISLDIHIDSDQRFVLPSYVLNCASLTSLEVDLNDGDLDTSIKACSSLQILSLKSFALFCCSNTFGEWISKTFVSIKKVHLLDFWGVCNLNIDSPSLEELVIRSHIEGKLLTSIKVSAERLENLSVSWLNDEVEDKLLEIYAPKLKDFHWTGDVSDYSYQGNFESLQNANIMLDISTNEDPAFINRVVINLLQTIHRVSSLCIWDLFALMVRHNLPLELDSLQTLTLLIRGQNLMIPEIASFLSSLSSLRVLKVHFDSYPFDEPLPQGNYNSVNWESQNLKFVDSLEEVEVILEEGEEYEIELVKYLLENTKVLKKMTILYDCKSLHQPFLISRKLQHFNKRSSSAEVYFLAE